MSIANHTNRHRVAIVGAGVTGAVAAAELARLASTSSSQQQNQQGHFQIVVFDQGRRGPGGRASHRSVRVSTGEVLPDDVEDIARYFSGDISEEQTYQFDHGCQFFRADSHVMREDLLKPWLAKGWVEPWKARLGYLPSLNDCSQEQETADFFGIPSQLANSEVYTSVGGMHLLPRRILSEYDTSKKDPKKEDNFTDDNCVKVYRGARVQSVQRNETSGKWDLTVISGSAAYHDTKQEQNPSLDGQAIHPDFDKVVFTDISSSSDAWHRASAGIPDSFRSINFRSFVRIPLFSTLVALRSPISQYLPFDAFATRHQDKLWFAAVQTSPSTTSAECWTLISTPSFAVKEIQSTTMRDPKTGDFRPQENSYLNSIPGPQLANAFIDLVRPYVEKQQKAGEGSDMAMPDIVYLQAQRWGSALPAPKSIVKTTVDVLGTTYASELLTWSLVYDSPTSTNRSDAADNDFIADDSQGLYYAGDFCSFRNPGFEASALSGLNVSRHIMRSLNSRQVL